MLLRNRTLVSILCNRSSHLQKRQRFLVLLDPCGVAGISGNGVPSREAVCPRSFDNKLENAVFRAALAALVDS
jgi:hypothetical protein